MSSVNRAWAIVRGRITGNRMKAQGLLNSIPEPKRSEIGRQEATARIRKRKKAYRLGERVK